MPVQRVLEAVETQRLPLRVNDLYPLPIGGRARYGAMHSVVRRRDSMPLFFIAHPAATNPSGNGDYLRHPERPLAELLLQLFHEMILGELWIPGDPITHDEDLSLQNSHISSSGLEME
jgi:hypothetical protein